jgi:methylase of polypeptide subunit release factors
VSMKKAQCILSAGRSLWILLMLLRNRELKSHIMCKALELGLGSGSWSCSCLYSCLLLSSLGR